MERGIEDSSSEFDAGCWMSEYEIGRESLSSGHPEEIPDLPQSWSAREQEHDSRKPRHHGPDLPQGAACESQKIAGTVERAQVLGLVGPRKCLFAASAQLLR